MVQAEVPGPERMVNPIQAIVQAWEEEHQDPMDQEEEHPHYQEGIQEAMPAAAHLQDIRHHSSQEEQVVQAALHQLHLQVYFSLADIQIHGLLARWVQFCFHFHEP